MKKVFYVLALIALVGCEEPQTAIDHQLEISSFEVDAEEVVMEGNRTSFLTEIEGLKIGGGECQSDDVARSGKHSIKIDSINPYSLVFELDHLHPGEYIHASVWQKKGSQEAALFVELNGASSSQSVRTFYTKCLQEKDGWIQHNIAFTVSPGIHSAKFNVFSGKKTAYFDDFKFEKKASIPTNDLGKEIAIKLGAKSSKKIANLIEKARQSPVIEDKFKKYVKGQFIAVNDTSRIKLKLKGDWSDHLSSGKISARIKMRGNSAYQGMKTFSLHHPKTRNYLDEWIAHQLAEREDVLTTTYDFVNVKVNDVRFGIYALEEHFDKQLLESRKRREGPILKFDETGVWELTHAEMMNGELADLPFYEASVVSMFKQNRTLSTPSLHDNFIEGAKLLDAFKNRSERIEQLFDIHQLAKYHVIVDLVGGVHAMAWHNRRFYYNPVTEQLEHILYDVMPFEKGEKYINSMLFHLSIDQWKVEDALLNPLIASEEFKSAYLYHLDRMTQPTYIDNFYQDCQTELQKFEKAIQQEEPYYQLDSMALYKMAAYHQSILSELNTKWNAYLGQTHEKDENIYKQPFYQVHDSINFEHIALNAYLGDSTEQGFEIYVENYQLGPVELCGYSSEVWTNHAYALEENVVVDGFESNNNLATVYTYYPPEQLFYKLKNYPNRYYSAEVNQWKKPQGKTERQQLIASNSWRELGSLRGNELIIGGQVKIDTLLYVPKGINVKIMSGCSIEFVRQGGLIINGDLDATATVAGPIELWSESESNNGLTVLNANSVKVKNMKCKGLSNLHTGRWMLTGGFTIYECPAIDMVNCTILDGRSEDALNIIRSDFNIVGLTINHCYSDGFDADFCTGSVEKSAFNYTGNDCIDFSGSQVNIEEIVIKESGDKGVSGGEDSQLTLRDIKIDGAITGIASKDKSLVEVDGLVVNDVEYYLMAFQKKAEYGPAQLIVNHSNFDWDSCKWVLDEGSIIEAAGRKEIGNKPVDVEALYARFE